MTELRDIESKLKAQDKLQGFTIESLIAFAVTTGALTPQELRQYLKSRLKWTDLPL